MVEDRIAALEARAATLEDKVRGLESARPDGPPVEPPPWAPYVSAGSSPPAGAWTGSAPPPAPRRAREASPSLATRAPLPVEPAHYRGAQRPGAASPYATAPRPGASNSRSGAAVARPARDFEDFVGGSLLAWLGGVAVLAGLAFLLTIAISRGWLGEGARTVLAGALSLGLLGAGVWLREHRGRTEAALVAAAVGIAGSFGTLVVAGPVYGLVPQALALLGAFVTGAVATVLAARWHAQAFGWLGLLGALLAPATLDALDGAGIVFLALTYAATIAVLVRQRWALLAGTAFAVVTLQWVAWLFLDTPGDSLATLTLVVFGALGIALALGLEANRPGLHPVAVGPQARPRPHLVAAMLLVLDAAVLAAIGWELLDGAQWLVALAVAHAALGVAAARVHRISRELALIAVAVGVVLADVAFASVATGLPLMLGWALSTLPFAALLGARSGERAGGVARLFDRLLGPAEGEAAVRADRILATAGLLGQMALAAGQAALFSAPPEALAGAGAPASMLLAAGALALVAWGCGRIAAPAWRTGLDALALTALAHLTGLALEGAALTAVLAAEALALAELARRREDPVAAWAAVAFAGAGVLHALAVIAPPDALLLGLDAPLAAAAALTAGAVAVAVAANTPLGDADAPRILRGAAAVTLLYLASVEVVTAGGAEHTGQTLLSVLWAVAGVGALIAGLVVDDRPLRRGALALLAITSAKVFLYDLAELESLYRVASLIAFGLLLLCGAFAYQRVRPRS